MLRAEIHLAKSKCFVSSTRSIAQAESRMSLGPDGAVVQMCPYGFPCTPVWRSSEPKTNTLFSLAHSLDVPVGALIY
jgi:hypothetical protein